MPVGFGRGRGGGRRKGSGSGVGRGAGLRGGGGRKFGINRSQNCICPSCGKILPHQPGFPCFQMNCPHCGSVMTRQFVVPDDSEKTDKTVFIQKPNIDADICTGCGECVDVCPVEAISLSDNTAIINENLCNNCRLCIPICPVEAIK